jgi:radical SAM superfamily enzyme YgiQ (UPF0313 family)
MNYIDFIIWGEPEDTLLELIENLHSYRAMNNYIKGIRGLYYRYKGEYYKTEKRAAHEDLDDFPMPKYEHFKLGQKYFNVCSLEASRHCYGNCIFCGGNVYRHQNGGGISRAKSADRIYDEINYVVKEHNVRFFAFQDDNFFYDGNEGYRRAEKLADLLIGQKTRIRFSIQCRASDISQDLFGYLKKAGLYKVFIGLESGSQDVLDRYNKGTTVNDNEKAINILENEGVRCQPGYILFDPYTTKKELRATINFFTPYKDRLFSFTEGLLETRYLELPTGCKAYEIFKHIPSSFSMVTPESFVAENYFLNKETINIYNRFNELIIKRPRKGSIFSDELSALEVAIEG